MGQAASMARSSWPRGSGQAIRPAARADHDPPAIGGVQGQATDIDIQAREILRMREELNRILLHHTGQTMEKIQRDTDRDFFMTAEQAKEYHIVDEVISSKPTPGAVQRRRWQAGRRRDRMAARTREGSGSSSARSAARARTTSAS